MSDTQKMMGMALGIGLFLFLSLVAGVAYTKSGAGHATPVAALPPADTAPAAPERGPETAAVEGPTPPGSTGDAVDRLTKAQDAVQRAVAAVNKASTNNHGGFVQKARTSARKAQSDVAAGMAFLAEHPEAVALHDSGDTTLVQHTEVPAYDVKAGGGYGSPNLAHALIALNEALDQLTVTPGSTHVISADLGSARDRLLEDIDQTAQQVMRAYEFAHSNAVPANPAPAVPGPLPVTLPPGAAGVNPTTNPNLP